MHRCWVSKSVYTPADVSKKVAQKIIRARNLIAADFLQKLGIVLEKYLARAILAENVAYDFFHFNCASAIIAYIRCHF